MNPLFLQACYLEIKSKLGNMSKRVTNKTLDGINIKWFKNIAQDIKLGKLKLQVYIMI